jgi:hypothetical protein
MRPQRRLFPIGFVLTVALSIVLFAREASAQLHWDASVQVGAMKRFLAERPSGGGDVGFGPTAQLTTHVALLPLLRVGAYVAHDISPLPGDGSARNITAGGLRAKGVFPLGPQARAWAFVGFGYAGVFQQSYETTIAMPTGAGTIEARAVRVEEAGGSFFDVPFGVGASYRLRKPWELCAELGARTGFGHVGSVYEYPGPQVKAAGLPDQNVVPAGLDRFAVGLTLGVLLDL